MGWLKCPVRNRKAQFYFYIYSCKSGSAEFEFSKQSPSIQLWVLWCTHGPAVRTSALPGSPSFLERFVSASYLDLTLDMIPCPLSCFSGIAHAEDARSVVEASCACPALPSCWREIFRCCFASSSLYPTWRKENNVKGLMLHLYLLSPRLTSWKELKSMSL